MLATLTITALDLVLVGAGAALMAAAGALLASRA
jgi:hypothetical protein